MLKVLDGVIKVLAAFARATYFITCLITLIGASGLAFMAIGQPWISVVLILVFVIPSGRALFRLARGGSLIPQPRLEERWDVSVIVAATSFLGNLLTVNLVIAVNQIIAQRKEGDGIVAFIVLNLILYSIALLCGELVLVGRHRPAPRTV